MSTAESTKLVVETLLFALRPRLIWHRVAERLGVLLLLDVVAPRDLDHEQLFGEMAIKKLNDAGHATVDIVRCYRDVVHERTASLSELAERLSAEGDMTFAMSKQGITITDQDCGDPIWTVEQG